MRGPRRRRRAAPRPCSAPLFVAVQKSALQGERMRLTAEARVPGEVGAREHGGEVAALGVGGEECVGNGRGEEVAGDEWVGVVGRRRGPGSAVACGGGRGGSPDAATGRSADSNGVEPEHSTISPASPALPILPASSGSGAL